MIVIRYSIFVVVATLISCGSKTNSENFTKGQSEKFIVSVDTLDLCFNGYLRTLVSFRGVYYGMIETKRLNTTQRFKKMISFTQNGQFVEDIFVPEEIQEMPHYDILVDNDSLYVKESQFERNNFVLGAYVGDFTLTKTKDFKIHEDSAFNVYSNCNGEFGGTIFFQSKTTKDNYEAASTCPIVVNKIGNTYYVTNYMDHGMGFASVLEIKDPTKLQKSQLRLHDQLGSKHEKGAEILLDTVNFQIQTSFVTGGKLYHIYSDELGTYIGEIKSGKMTPEFKFKFGFYSRFTQQVGGRQILTCHFADNGDNGFLIIEGNRLRFHRMR